MDRPLARSARCSLLVALVLLAFAPDASAICDVIPAASSDFRGALGSLNRPFASPDDFVSVAVRPPACDETSTGFVDLDLDGDAADDYRVSVIFTPPNGAANAIVLAESCAGLDLSNCNTDLGPGGTAECVELNAGGSIDLVVPSLNELRFRFPDSDDRLGGVNDDRTLAGPAKIVVTRRNAPLQCGLATQRCADLGGDTSTHGVVACVDELFRLDGTCRTSPADLAERFGHFVALPPPNDIEAMIANPGITEVHFTTDAAGNILAPMDYTGILLRIGGVPIPQLARGATNVDADTDLPGQPVTIPGDGFISSHSPGGIILPPVFTALANPAVSDAELFGSVDAPRGVIRIARRGCVGGDDEGKACTVDGECSSSVCSNELFDFSDRYDAGIGPVVLLGSGGEYTAVLDDPVPLEGLVEGAGNFAFVISENVDGVDRNADGDPLGGEPGDFVVTLRDRTTGILQPIGDGGSDGRAAVRTQEGPFRFPAVAVEGSVMAFLESEPGQGDTDTNANANVFDPILKSFALGVGELSPAGPLTAASDPVIDGRTLALSDGTVFFRTPEAAEATQLTERLSLPDAGGEGNDFSTTGFLGRGGRDLAFTSFATNIVAGDTNQVRDVFIRDRVAGTTVRVSVDSNGDEGEEFGPGCCNGVGAAGSGFAADGRFVAFSADFDDLVPGDTNADWDAFVHDRDFDQDGIYDEQGQPGGIATVRVSVQSDGSEAVDGGGFSFASDISPDGRFVVITSRANDLAPGEGNWGLVAVPDDAFLHDRDADGDGLFDGEGNGIIDPGEVKTIRISIDAAGNGGNNRSVGHGVSHDGRYVLFSSFATNLVAGDTDGLFDMFVHDRDADEDGIFDDEGDGYDPGEIEIIMVSVSSTGEQGNDQGSVGQISGDGRFVVFSDDSNNLVAGDTNSVQDIFLHDRDADENGVFDEPGGIATTRISVGSSGEEADGQSEAPHLSPDSRFIAFYSAATNLVDGDTNGVNDVFVHDRASGLTTRMSLDTAGNEADAASFLRAVPPFASDGRSIVFDSGATNLVGGDGNMDSDVFVRGPDPSDFGADLSFDGDLDDTVLRSLDTTVGPPGVVTNLCPAGRVAVAAGSAAFLRPEGAGGGGACPGGVNFNGDGDIDDQVVHLATAGGVQNLQCAASDVAMSGTFIAGLVPEADAGGAFLNGDADASDRVLHVLPLGVTPFLPCSANIDAPPFSWDNVGQAADSIDVSGELVAFITPEAEQAGLDATSDGDAADRYVQLYDAAALSLLPIEDGSGRRQPAEEFVMGEDLLAFRSHELDFCDAAVPSPDCSAPAGCVAISQCDLNGDGDCCDDGLQVYDMIGGQLLNTGQAVTPCRLSECEPRNPYRVSSRTVRFLTFEGDQGEDLNEDGDQDDVLVQVYNVVSGETRPVAEVTDPDDGTGSDPLQTPSEDDPGEGSDQVIVTEGRCVVDTTASCTPGAPGTCGAGEFCFDPDPEATIGSCVRDTGRTCDLDKPTAEQGCDPDATCVEDIAVLGVADRDRDQVPDALDNCPDAPNVEQADADLDGVGDACDLETCGNGAVEIQEECDDGNLAGGDACDPNCTLPSCGNGIVNAGETCDDGNQIDGDGCSADCSSAAAPACPLVPATCRTDALNLTIMQDRLEPADGGVNGDNAKLVFKWLRGGVTDFNEFGDPVGGGAGLCFYADDALRTQLAIPPGSPNWIKVIPGKLYRYVDKAAAADGIRSVLLRSDATTPGKSKLTLVAKGAEVGADSDRPIPAFQPSVGIGAQTYDVQFHPGGGGSCFGMRYDDPPSADVYIDKDVGVFKLRRTGP